MGSDTGTGVNDADYQTPFAFDGKLNKLTLALEPQGKAALPKGLLWPKCGCELMLQTGSLGRAAPAEQHERNSHQTSQAGG